MSVFWRIIGTVLALAAIAALQVVAWWGCDAGLWRAPSFGPAAKPHSAVVDTHATAYSPGQLLGPSHLTVGMTHRYWEDETFIPVPDTYVRLEFLASHVEKPFPVLYVIDRPEPMNIWRFEFEIEARPQAIGQFQRLAGDLSCDPRSGDMTATDNDLFEVRWRGPGEPLRRCLISKEAGCDYLRRVRVRLELIDREDYRFKDTMQELQGRMGCSRTLY